MSSARPSPRGVAGEAATTQRVRAEAGGEMASAMAAVVPPYSGGKVYATHHGVFTFVNVLFDVEGRLLCTLDGDELTRLRTPAACALAVRAWPLPAAAIAALVGAGRQGWSHLAMLAAELPVTLRRCAYTTSSPTAASELVARAGRGRHPGDDRRDGGGTRSTAPRSSSPSRRSTEPLFPADVGRRPCSDLCGRARRSTTAARSEPTWSSAARRSCATTSPAAASSAAI